MPGLAESSIHRFSPGVGIGVHILKAEWIVEETNEEIKYEGEITYNKQEQPWIKLLGTTTSGGQRCFFIRFDKTGSPDTCTRLNALKNLSTPEFDTVHLICKSFNIDGIEYTLK